MTERQNHFLNYLLFRYSFSIVVALPEEKVLEKVGHMLKCGYELEDSTFQHFRGELSGNGFEADLITPDVRGVSFALRGEIAPLGEKKSALTVFVKIKDDSGMKMLLGFLALAFCSGLGNLSSSSPGQLPGKFSGFLLFATFGFLLGYTFNLATYWSKSRLMKKIFSEEFSEEFHKREKPKKKKARPQAEGMTPEESRFFMLCAAVIALVSIVSMLSFSPPWSFFLGIMATITVSLFGGGLCTFVMITLKEIPKFLRRMKPQFRWMSLPLAALKVIGMIMLITGISIVMHGILATCGFTPWITSHTELPIAPYTRVAVDRGGNSYVFLSFLCRFQKYDSAGTFLSGWFIHSGGKPVSFKVNSDNDLEFYTMHNIHYTADSWGRVKKRKASSYEKRGDFEKTCKATAAADVTALKEKMDGYPFYLWLVSGPQCIILFAAGLLLLFLTGDECAGRWLLKEKRMLPSRS
ncbi:MAG: hypothetical protein RDV48_28160 [Candidatus Eremiobacteraeota bacterium]|nr:hypothetical protein [Candidatus Eremiobacteraeota bacterium]